MEKEKQIFTLHRYFIWATTLKDELDKVLLKNRNLSNKTVEIQMYMSIWYGLLYVVVEGWKKIQLKDEIIDNLLKSKNVHLLRRYRNYVFHFQEKYFDERATNFYKEKDTAQWVRELNKEFGRYFLNYFKGKIQF